MKTQFQKKRYLFVSPHLDDAVLSCGGFITKLVKAGNKVTIVTVFTEAEAIFHSRYTTRNLHHCGLSSTLSPQDFFALRRREDIAACNLLNTDFLHLGFSDAAWRINPHFWRPLINVSFLNHYSFIYRDHKAIFSGKINPLDHQLAERVGSKIRNIVNRLGSSKTLVFGPMGTGKHVDHLITRLALEQLDHPQVYWLDYPYSRGYGSPHQKKGIFKIKTNKKTKEAAIRKYSSQLKPLFDNKIELDDEVYLEKISE